MDSWDRFEETKLPPKDFFYSSLSMSRVSETDYEHARKVGESLELITWESAKICT